MSTHGHVQHGIGSEMRDFLDSLGLKSLGMTFANEDISVGDLRKMYARGEEEFEDSMRAINLKFGEINALKEALADNWSVTVFPEGTTTDGRSLLPFKSSMLSVLEPPPAGVKAP